MRETKDLYRSEFLSAPPNCPSPAILQCRKRRICRNRWITPEDIEIALLLVSLKKGIPPHGIVMPLAEPSSCERSITTRAAARTGRHSRRDHGRGAGEVDADFRVKAGRFPRRRARRRGGLRTVPRVTRRIPDASQELLHALPPLAFIRASTMRSRWLARRMISIASTGSFKSTSR